MLPKPRSTLQEARLLLEVLLADDNSPQSSSACAPPLTVDAFRKHLSHGPCNRTLGHCLDFLDWLSDYTVRFEQLAPDIQSKSPPVDDKINSLSAKGHGAIEMRQITTPKGPHDVKTMVSPAKQPLRGAVDFCQLRYLNPGAPANLRMPLSLRDSTLEAISTTTHPSAFNGVSNYCRDRLAIEAMPCFITSALKNLSPRSARIRYVLSIGLFVLTIALTALSVLLSWPRWFRLAFAPLLFLAVLTAVLASLGFCAYRYYRRIREDADHPSSATLSASVSPFDDLESARKHDLSNNPSGKWEANDRNASDRRKKRVLALTPVKAPLILRLQRRLLLRSAVVVAVPVTVVTLTFLLLIPESIDQSHHWSGWMSG